MVERTDQGPMVRLYRPRGWAVTLPSASISPFLRLIMHPIAQAFGVSMTAVTFVFTITLWMRLVGATASGSARRPGGSAARRR